jgi:hypothetical protein
VGVGCFGEQCFVPGFLGVEFHLGVQLRVNLPSSIAPIAAPLNESENIMNDNIIELLGQDAEQDVESLPEGNALGSFSTLSSASSSGSSAASASTVGCIG